MNKQINKFPVFAALLLMVVFFFAGISSVYAQNQEPDELKIYQGIVANQCEVLIKKVNLLEKLKRENNFDYSKLNYEKKAYQFEIEGLVHLEKSLQCLNELDNNLFKSCLEVFENKKLDINKECNAPDAENKLDKYKFTRQEFINSAKFLEKAELEYFDSQHLKLESGKKYNKKGELIEGSGLDNIITDNVVMRAGKGFLYSTQDSLEGIFRGNLIKKVNRALGTLAILYLFILGVKFIMARGDSERLSDLKGQFAWIILGLGVISVAEFIGYEVFDPSDGKNVLEGGSALSFKMKVAEIARLFEYLAGGLMLINALISGYGLIMGGEDDEAISKEKQFLKSFLMGTAFILLSEVIVRALSFENLRESSEIVINEVAGLVNFSLSFIGIVATAMLVMAGLYYVISFGDDEQMGRAKKMIIASIAGIVIAFSAYTIVRFLIV